MDKEEFDKQVAAGKQLVIINGKVYDVENLIPIHPGGEDKIDKNLSGDGSEDFNGKGHSEKAKEELQKYYLADFKA